MKVTLVIGALAILISANAEAFKGDETTIRGRVKSFDQSNVTLESDKAVYKIPRKLVLIDELKTGQTLSVSVSQAVFDSLQVNKKK